MASSSASVDTSKPYGTFDVQSNQQQQPTQSSHRYGGALLRAAGVAGILVLAGAAYLTSTGRFHNQSAPVEGSTSLLSELEKSFVTNISRTNIKEYLHAYSSSPHVCGSEQDYETVLYTAKMLESFGIKAEIREYQTLLSTPVHRHLAIVEPAASARKLNLTEGTAAGDACTTNEDALPPFLAYAASGNVTASVVYTNFGTQADFQWLVDHNVSLEGKISLVRYGGSFRSTKVMLAEQHGMAGVLIYSDPKEDGYVVGPVYPEGPWRPEDSFQRGSIDYLQISAGDPLTPGFPSKPGAPYLEYEECESVPHIPALPLSYGQAKYILKSLKGTKAPESWQGGLTLDEGYYVGDDEATVLNFDLEMDNKIGAIWDVIGTIEGAEEPDQQVLIGNHRDAWVCGAIDPNSGSSVLLEIARGFGELLKQGWKPRRTIKLGSWDGEEYGLLGSTEYAEDEAERLTKQAVAYLNVDAFIGNAITAGGTPSIATFLQETAKAVPPNRFYGNETETSLYEQWVAQNDALRASIGGPVPGTLAPDYLISLLGSGTDFTGFYQHLGIISANMAFGLKGGASYGTYHSTMDSIMYSETVGNPGYASHEAIAQWWGVLTLRLANLELLPFDYSTYGVVMAEQLQSFEAQFATLDRTADFSTLSAAIQEFTKNAKELQANITAFTSSGNDIADAEQIRQWNDKLVHLERYLLSDKGLPHRPWYKHVIFGPGYYEGYAGTAFPGIADSLVFFDNATATQDHIYTVASVVKSAADYIVSA